ncbi:MAG: alpha/beta fold hydrolase [Bacteroidia bacterium]
MQHLNFKHYGENGESLIILHGFLGTLDNWHTLSTKFSQHFNVYNIDQRNHGKSFHTQSHTIAEMVEDLLWFINQNNLKKVNIIGHSMGGKVAMQFSLSHANLVQKLIVADIAPRQYPKGHDDVFNAIFAVKLNEIKSRKDAEEMMLPYLPDFGVRQFILKNLERKEDGTFTWKMNLEVLQKDYSEILKEVTTENPFMGEVLFLKGGNSRYLQEKDLPQIFKLFPNAKVQTIAEAGHWLHAEKPDEFYRAVIDFLNPIN